MLNLINHNQKLKHKPSPNSDVWIAHSVMGSKSFVISRIDSSPDKKKVKNCFDQQFNFKNFINSKEKSENR